MLKLILKKAGLLLICLSILLSSIVVINAEGVASPAEIDTLLLNRDFEDNTVATNGFSSGIQYAGNTIKLEKESGNTYLHWVADSTDSVKHGHFNIEIGAYLPDSGSVVVRFKIKTDDAKNPARAVVQYRPYDYHYGEQIAGPNGEFLGYKASMFDLATLGVYSNKPALGLLNSSRIYSAEGFKEVTVIYTWQNKTNVTATAYYDGGTTPVYSLTTQCYGYDARPTYFRFQVQNGTGLEWDLDDLLLFTSESTDQQALLAVTVPSNNRGVLFNSGAGVYVDPDALNGNNFFKVGVDKALDADGSTVYKLPTVPFKKNGEVYIPASALTTVLGSAPSSNAVTNIDGLPSVNIKDMSLAYPGIYESYSTTGLIAVSEKENVFENAPNANTLIPAMQKFIFDHVDSSLAKVEAFVPEEGQYTDHPYIMANQDKFDSLRATYLGEGDDVDTVLQGLIAGRVSAAASVYKNYANVVDGSYSSLKTNYGLSAGQGGNLNYMPWMEDDGYDIGGRTGPSSSHTTNIMNLAYGYQITRDENYARLAYDYAVALGNWEHWGPGHFLNCADAAAPYALAYDWLYDAWVELGLDVEHIAEVIFTHAVIPGYYSIYAKTIPEGWMRCISGNKTRSGWSFNTGSNNWNAVCSSGMVIASLAIMGDLTPTANIYIDTDVNTVAHEKSMLITELGDHTGMENYQDYAASVLNQCMYGLEMYGLSQYIPDGSYIESNGYWSYGTNNLFELVAALSTAVGYNTGSFDDFGLLDAWGLDRTCYYAINTQSGDYMGWNYHDSNSTGAQDTTWFYFVGNYTGDTDIAEIRHVALASGKCGNGTIQDTIFYKKSTGSYAKPELQYHMEGINAYVVRDSWEPGSIYAGMIGDTNNLGHGQIDSGSFVYHNGGTIWFCDLGTENYNCYGFWSGATRYRYYMMNAEGNNTLFVAGQDKILPYGQSLSGFGVMTETGDNKYGAYAIIDNTSVYAGIANYAYRGMLLTNDRRTLVIQDEVQFAKPQDAYWVGHTQQQLYLSVDGTVAYMYDGKTTIRVTIVDKNNSGAHFEIEDCFTYHLPASEGMDELAEEYYELGTHERNKDRSSYSKLAIAFNKVTSINVAIVIEEMAVGEINELGYQWQDISVWDEDTPSENGKVTKSTVLDLGDTEELGAVSTINNGNLVVTNAIIDGNALYQVNGATSSTKAGSVSFKAQSKLAEYGFLGDRTIVAELDIGTLGGYPSGVMLGIAGTGGSIASFKLTDLGVISDGITKRITIILRGEEGDYFAFFGDALVAKGSFVNSSVEDISIIVSHSGGSVTGGTLLLDNLKLRIFSSTYGALDLALSGEDITGWTDRTPLGDGDGNPVARIVTQIEIPPADFDTPIINLTGSSYINVAQSHAELITEFYSWDDVEQSLSEGVVLELLTDNNFSTITVDCPITVNTNGFKLNAVSNNYIAIVSDNTISYKKGGITVTWVTASGEVKEVYTGSIPATYKKSLPTTIREEQTDNGYAYYVSSGWSQTSGGSPMDENDMVVTSKNCRFYLVDRPYDGSFVTVKGSTITGYTSADNLFKTILNTTYDRISLTSDISYDSTGISDSPSLSKVVNLYLNGNSIYYESLDTSDHAFTISNSFNVHGPGEINSTAANSNLFFQQQGNSVIRDVTINSVRGVTDHRGGYIEFNNCVINITANTNAFGATNRNNANTTEATMPYINLQGCEINMPHSTATQGAFELNCNARLELGGGTVLNTGVPCIMIKLKNSTIGAVENFDYANAYTHMAAKIGDFIHNCAILCSTGTNDTSGETYEDMAEKIYYIKGAVLTNNTPEIDVYEGYKIVRGSNSVYPYEVVAMEEAVDVTWKVGAKVVTEKWKKGCVPTPDSEAVKQIIADATEAGETCIFPNDVVTTATTLTATIVTEIPVSMSLLLDKDIKARVYIKQIDGVELDSIALDGSIVDGEAVTLADGNYIRITISYGSPNLAAAFKSLTINFRDTNRSINGVVTKRISVIDYVENILSSSEQDASLRTLAASILGYIRQSYIYSEHTDREEYIYVNSVYSLYLSDLRVSAAKRAQTELGGVKNALDGAALVLRDEPMFRFYVKEGYNGDITISYTSKTGEAISHKYTSDSFVYVNDANGEIRRCIDVEPSLCDMLADITITCSEGSAVYSIYTYYNAIASDYGEELVMLNSLLAYIEATKLYLNIL